MSPNSTTPTTLQTQSETARIAQSLLPYNYDDNRAKYLSYRASGFTTREALKMAGCAVSTVSMWRRDPKFVELENSLPEISKKLRSEYTSLEFVRNFRMVMEKDYRVLRKALSKETMDKQEMDYLLKLRAFYTPQQLQIIEAVVQGDLNGTSMGWTELVLMARKTEERVVRVRQSTNILHDDSIVDSRVEPCSTQEEPCSTQEEHAKDSDSQVSSSLSPQHQESTAQ